jgi:hypothetical protein
MERGAGELAPRREAPSAWGEGVSLLPGGLAGLRLTFSPLLDAPEAHRGVSATTEVNAEESGGAPASGGERRPRSCPGGEIQMRGFDRAARRSGRHLGWNPMSARLTRRKQKRVRCTRADVQNGGKKRRDKRTK